MAVTWSYSSIKTFDQCPKKYYHLRVAKDVKDEGGEAAIYGTAVHEAAELYVKSGQPIPNKFGFMQSVVDALVNLPGDKLPEQKLGLAKTEEGYAPVQFFAPNVWWRGIADLIILNGDRAICVDYKTGKSARYADTKQLDLLAGAIFYHYPQVKRVKSALLYVISNEVVRKTHVVEERDAYLSAFDLELARLEVAMETGVFNAVSGPLCRFCPVVDCPNNRKGY